jgi:hypothetical protein
VTGLLRVVTYPEDDGGASWLWGSSDRDTGLWKVVPTSVGLVRPGRDGAA